VTSIALKRCRIEGTRWTSETYKTKSFQQHFSIPSYLGNTNDNKLNAKTFKLILRLKVSDAPADIEMSSNYSFYTVPIAYIFALMPHVFAVRTYTAASKKEFNMKQPRGFTASVQSDQSIDSLTKGRILRAEAAHANNMENVSLFAAAVVAGNLAKVDAWWLNVLSIGYLADRFVYNHVYIYQDLVPGALRSVVHFSGVAMVLGLFVLAGNAVK
jgi:uncharacterized MAPEG superfamily protein